MKIHFTRIIFGLIIGSFISFLVILMTIDFSIVEVNINANNLPIKADYLKMQADFKNVLALRDIDSDENKLVLTIYNDFTCDSCKLFNDQVWPWIKFALVDKGLVDLKYRFYPLLDTHKESLLVNQSVLCAAEQGDFFTFKDQLFAKQSEWRDNTALSNYLIDLAKVNRYRESTFRRCLLGSKFEDFVKLELNDALSNGISGAPTVVLSSGDEKVVLEGVLTTLRYEQEFNKLSEKVGSAQINSP